jgi:chorismate mutase
MPPENHLRDVVRPKLMSLEDSIIFHILERAQFKSNDDIYLPGKIQGVPEGKSFFGFLFDETEQLYAKMGKFQNPEEYPHTPSSLEPIVKRKAAKGFIDKPRLNFNKEIIDAYMDFMRGVCQKGDDGEYGSSTVCDICVIDYLSRRIHIGTQVAEAKFLSDPEAYREMILSEDESGIIEKLTDKNVELNIHQRVQLKTEYFQKISGECDKTRKFVEPKVMKELYERLIIPITIQVELAYFKNKELK